MALIDEEYRDILDELGAPKFLHRMTNKEFEALRKWVTQLIHHNQDLAEDEIDSLFYTDDECRGGGGDDE